MSTNPTVVDPLENSITLQAPKKARKPFLPYFARTDAGGRRTMNAKFARLQSKPHVPASRAP